MPVCISHTPAKSPSAACIEQLSVVCLWTSVSRFHFEKPRSEHDLAKYFIHVPLFSFLTTEARRVSWLSTFRPHSGIVTALWEMHLGKHPTIEHQLFHYDRKRYGDGMEKQDGGGGPDLYVGREYSACLHETHWVSQSRSLVRVFLQCLFVHYHGILADISRRTCLPQTSRLPL